MRIAASDIHGVRTPTAVAVVKVTSPPSKAAQKAASAPGSSQSSVTSTGPVTTTAPNLTCAESLRVGVEGGQLRVAAGQQLGLGRRAAGDVVVEEVDGHLVDRVEVGAPIEERREVGTAEEGEEEPRRSGLVVDRFAVLEAVDVVLVALDDKEGRVG